MYSEWISCSTSHNLPTICSHKAMLFVTSKCSHHFRLMAYITHVFDVLVHLSPLVGTHSSILKKINNLCRLDQLASIIWSFLLHRYLVAGWTLLCIPEKPAYVALSKLHSLKMSLEEGNGKPLQSALYLKTPDTLYGIVPMIGLPGQQHSCLKL